MFKENEKVINLDIGLSTVVSVNKNTCILENNLGETITIEDDSKTRKLIDRKDAFSLLDKVKSLSDEWIKTPRLRYEKYQRDLYAWDLCFRSHPGWRQPACRVSHLIPFRTCGIRSVMRRKKRKSYRVPCPILKVWWRS